MKWILLIVTCVNMIYTMSATAEIKNGYKQELLLAKESFKNIDSLLQKLSDEEQIDQMSKYRKKVKDRFVWIRVKYMKTEKLLMRLAEVFPRFYQKINSIQDFLGNETDVYVKVVDRCQFSSPNILATTNLDRSNKSEHIYTSEYGDGTISVKVRDMGFNTSLKMLTHEFGHVQYQVPNLSSYFKFYKRYYMNYTSLDKSRGHLANDPSNQSVKLVLKKFRKAFKNYKTNNQLPDFRASGKTSNSEQ